MRQLPSFNLLNFNLNAAAPVFEQNYERLIVLGKQYLNLRVGWMVEVHILDFRRARCVCLCRMVVVLWELSSPSVKSGTSDITLGAKFVLFQ